MKSNLKITLSFIALLSTVLVSAAASPAAEKISAVDYLVDLGDSTEYVEDMGPMSGESLELIDIEAEEISNDYELMQTQDKNLKPSEVKDSISSSQIISKPSSSVSQQSSSNKPASSSKPQSSSSSITSVGSSSKPASSQQSQATVAPPAVNTAHSLFFSQLPLNVSIPTAAPAVRYLSNTVAAKYKDERGELLKFKSGSTTYTLPVKQALKHVVSNEVNESISYEAVKAQVVASHTYIKYYNDNGSIPSVGYKANYKVGGKIDRAVEEVYNIIATYNGKAIYSPYHACSSGSTQSSKEVWGGSRAYLVAVDSKYDYLADYTNGVKTKSNYLATKTLSAEYVKNRIISKMGVTPSGDPSTWFKFVDKNNSGYTSGNYVNRVVVAGVTKSGITVRTMFNLRSACFDIKYQNGNFIFTTKGYGHGVGMSQWGAHFYAEKQSWNFEKIICHYYKGVTLAKVA